MDGRKQIREYIKKEVNKLFEILDFQGDEARQINVSKAQHELPRKGIADTINNFNELEAQKEREESQEQRSAEIETNFKGGASNNAIATTLTNIYEDATVNSYSQVGQDNLDYERTTRPPKAINPFGKEQKDTIEDFNDNIEKSLNQVKFPGETDGMMPPTNKTSTPVAQ